MHVSVHVGELVSGLDGQHRDCTLFASACGKHECLCGVGAVLIKHRVEPSSLSVANAASLPSMELSGALNSHEAQYCILKRGLPLWSTGFLCGAQHMMHWVLLCKAQSEARQA